MTKTSLRLLPLFLACILYPAAPAQTLARPGWVGSGMSADLWWQHAVVYHVNPANFSPTDGTGLHGIIQRLDYLHSLGVDALLLTPIQLNLTHAQSIDPAYGTLDDLDDLIHEASRHNIRVLLDLDPQISNADMSTFARFWLNRGIAGFHVIGSTDISHAQVAILHKATDSYLGQRIVIADVDPSLPPDLRQRTYRAPDPQGPQLTLDPRPGTTSTLSAATIRPAIDTLQDILQAGHSLPLLATDGPVYKRSMSRYADGQHDLAIAKVVATLLFTTRAEPLLYYGQELGAISPPAPDAASTIPIITWDALPSVAKGKSTALAKSQPSVPNASLQDADPNSLLNWYRQLSALRHSSAAISSGAAITLNHDDQNILVWVRKPQVVTTISPAIVVICNLSAQSVQLSIKSDMQRLHLRGSFLRTLLRADNGRGPMDLEFMTLPPYAIYIGELRY